MTDVEKSKVLHIWHVCDVEIVAIYAQFLQNLRAFMWRKIEPKSTFVEKNDKYEACGPDLLTQPVRLICQTTSQSQTEAGAWNHSLRARSGLPRYFLFEGIYIYSHI